MFQHIGTVHIDLFSEQPFHAVTSGHFIIALLVSIKDALTILHVQEFFSVLKTKQTKGKQM